MFSREWKNFRKIRHFSALSRCRLYLTMAGQGVLSACVSTHR